MSSNKASKCCSALFFLPHSWPFLETFIYAGNTKKLMRRVHLCMYVFGYIYSRMRDSRSKCSAHQLFLSFCWFVIVHDTFWFSLLFPLQGEHFLKIQYMLAPYPHNERFVWMMNNQVTIPSPSTPFFISLSPSPHSMTCFSCVGAGSREDGLRLSQPQRLSHKNRIRMIWE